MSSSAVLEEPTFRITVHNLTKANTISQLDLPISTEAYCSCCDTLGTVDTCDEHLARRLHTVYAWDPAFMSELVDEYRKFLELKCCVRDQAATRLSPSPLIEQVWAEDSLDTCSYDRNCQSIHEKHCATPFVPLPHVSGVSTSKLAATRLAYEARFNKVPDEKFWGLNAVAERRRKKIDRARTCLAAKVEHLTGIPITQFRLLCNGRVLRAGATLLESGVVDGSDVYVVLNLRGC